MPGALQPRSLKPGGPRQPSQGHWRQPKARRQKIQSGPNTAISLRCDFREITQSLRDKLLQATWGFFQDSGSQSAVRGPGSPFKESAGSILLHDTTKT